MSNLRTPKLQLVINICSCNDTAKKEIINETKLSDSTYISTVTKTFRHLLIRNILIKKLLY